MLPTTLCRAHDKTVARVLCKASFSRVLFQCFYYVLLWCATFILSELKWSSELQCSGQTRIFLSQLLLEKVEGTRYHAMEFLALSDEEVLNINYSLILRLLFFTHSYDLYRVLGPWKEHWKLVTQGDAMNWVMCTAIFQFIWHLCWSLCTLFRLPSKI